MKIFNRRSESSSYCGIILLAQGLYKIMREAAL